MLVTKEELLAGVWSEAIVEESNLSVHISTIRRILGDNVSQPIYIETVARRGYRFIAPVSEVSVEAPAIRLKPDPESPLPLPLPPPPPRAKRSRWGLGALITAAMLGLAALWSGVFRREDGNWDPRPLTTAPGLEYAGALSPDATMVVYAVRSPTGERGLRMVKLDKSKSTQEAIQLTKEIDVNPTWSPDGKEIAYLRFEKAEPQVDRVLLRVMEAFGNQDRTVAEVDFTGPPPAPMLQYTPDGEKILTNFGAGAPPGAAPRRLVEISIRTGEVRTILDPVSGMAGDSAPALSPDGKTLAFCRCATSSLCNLYVVPVRNLIPTGPPVQLTNSPSPEFRPVFLKDGSLVYPLGPPDVRTFQRTWFDWLGRPHSTTISSMGEDVSEPSVAYTHEGKLRLVYTRNIIDPNIWGLQLDRPDGDVVAASPVIASTRSDQTPAFSPDGQRIAFGSTRSGQWEIWTCNAAGGDCKQITSTGPAFAQNPVYSPNGKWIVYESRSTAHAQLFLVPATGGPSTQLTSGENSNLYPFWTPDGKWLYFSSNRTGQFEIYRSPAPSSPTSKITFEAVTTTGGTAPRISMDGSLLVYRGTEGSYYRRSIVESAIEKAESQRVNENSALMIGPPILALGTMAYAYVSDNRQGFLARLDLATGTHTKLKPLDLRRAMGLARSPDGRKLLYTVNDTTESDLMIIDLPPFR